MGFEEERLIFNSPIIDFDNSIWYSIFGVFCEHLFCDAKNARYTEKIYLNGVLE